MTRASTLALIVALACSSPSSPPQPGQPREAVRVNLPEGWRAESADPGRLLVGPAGRPVLRIDHRPGRGGDLPSTEVLLEGVRAGVRHAEVVPLDARRTGSLVAASYRLQIAGGESTTAFVAAASVGADLFLCASLPGASPEDVARGVRACEGLAPSRGAGDGG